MHRAWRIVYQHVFFLLFPAVPLAQTEPIEIHVHPIQTDIFTKNYTKERIERYQNYTTDSLLSLTPGLSFVKRNGLTQAVIRGSPPAQTLVCIDGVMVNDPSAPNNTYDLSQLDTELVDSIRVISGPEALQYGTGGAGVIDIRLRKPSQSFKGWARGEIGSFDQRTETIGAEGKHHDVAAVAIAKLARTGSGSRFNTQHGNSVADWDKKRQVYGRVALQVSPLHTLTLSGQAGAQKTHLDTVVGPLPFAQGDLASKNHHLLTAVSHYFSPTGAWENMCSIAHTESHRHYQGTIPSTFEGNRWAVTNHLTFHTTPSFTNSLEGGWQQDTWVRKNQRFYLRYGHVRYHGIWSPASWFRIHPALRMDMGNDDITRPTAQVRAELDVTQKTTVQAGIGTGLRIPSLYELNGSPPHTNPNPDLGIETLRQAEVSVKHVFIQNILTGQLSVFRIWSDQAIVYVPATQRFENRDQRRSQGVETVVSIAPSSSWTINLSHTYVQAKEHPKAPIIRLPHHKVCVDASYKITANVQVFSSVIYESRRRDSVYPGFVRLASVTDWRFGGTYQPCDFIKIHARVENALNQKRESLFGYGRRGFGIFAGITLMTGA